MMSGSVGSLATLSPPDMMKDKGFSRLTVRIPLFSGVNCGCSHREYSVGRRKRRFKRTY